MEFLNYKGAVSFIIIFLNMCGAYKVLLVFPFPGKSHGILGEGYAKLLLGDGHEVTYITAVPIVHKSNKLRQIDVSANFQTFVPVYLDINHILEDDLDMTSIQEQYLMMLRVANTTLSRRKVQDLMLDLRQTFDVVIAEWMYSELYSGLSYIFQCPLIWASSMEPRAAVLSVIDQAPNPAYTTDYFSEATPPLGFVDRVAELHKLVDFKISKWLISGLDQETFTNVYKAAAEKRGLVLPAYEAVQYNASLMLGNSHVSTGAAMSLPEMYKPIGGYHIPKNIKDLPKDLQKLMDNAEHGIIFFSMGSVLNFTQQLPEKMRKRLIKMLKGLKQEIIWKSEFAIENPPKNIHILDWAPQQSILNHPNCQLFITHGGPLSITESLHAGVPIIGIPIVADQFTNVLNAASKGYGKYVLFSHHFVRDLRVAIKDILGDDRQYFKKASMYSFVYHHRPAPPSKELVHWVAHVIDTRGALHLRSPALYVPWYQILYLDLLALILVICFLLVSLLRRLCAPKRKTNLNIKEKDA